MNYLQLTNAVLAELNEVQLTSSNFASSSGIQTTVKDKNRGIINTYMDITLYNLNNHSILPHSLSLDQHRHVREQAALLDRALHDAVDEALLEVRDEFRRLTRLTVRRKLPTPWASGKRRPARS